MADHISYMLDNMVTAVDEGLSYDGIVSVPETGLEDVKPRSSLTGSLRDSVDRVLTTSATISRGAGRAASVFKRKWQQQDSSHHAREGSIREKSRSELSLALSDQPSDDLADTQDEELSTSSMVHSETGERNHFTREQVAVQCCGDDETDIVPGCSWRPPFIRTRSEPISVAGVCISHPEQKLDKEWHFVPPVIVVDTGEGELPGKNGEERSRWRTRFQRGSQERRARSVQLSDIKQEGLPEKENGENMQRNSEKDSVVPNL